MNYFSYLLVALSLLGTAHGAEKMAPDVNEIVAKAEAVRSPIYSYETTVVIQDFDDQTKSGPERGYTSKIKPGTGALVEFDQPKTDAGKKMLMVEDNMWLKFPSSANPLRVSARQKLTGQAANGDIVGISYVSNYDAEYVEQIEEDGKAIHRIKLTAKPGKLVTYEVIDYYVEAATYKPVRAVYMTKSGRALRTGHYLDYQSVEGVPRPTRIEIVDAVEQGRRTEIRFTGYKKAKFSSLIFKRSYLDR